MCGQRCEEKHSALGIIGLLFGFPMHWGSFCCEECKRQWNGSGRIWFGKKWRFPVSSDLFIPALAGRAFLQIHAIEDDIRPPIRFLMLRTATSLYRERQKRIPLAAESAHTGEILSGSPPLQRLEILLERQAEIGQPVIFLAAKRRAIPSGIDFISPQRPVLLYSTAAVS